MGWNNLARSFSGWGVSAWRCWHMGKECCFATGKEDTPSSPVRGAPHRLTKHQRARRRGHWEFGSSKLPHTGRRSRNFQFYPTTTAREGISLPVAMGRRGPKPTHVPAKAAKVYTGRGAPSSIIKTRSPAAFGRTWRSQRSPSPSPLCLGATRLWSRGSNVIKVVMLDKFIGISISPRPAIPLAAEATHLFLKSVQRSGEPGDECHGHS
ncbi:hypothetical protein QBC39DRAFT_29909 [Podospora conica]|nr:hypothetical protein QBC39DRAFT_29909 [Schizothecium conicum]